MNVRTKRRAGRPPIGGKPLDRVNVMLSDRDMKGAEALGGGSISAGLRIALERVNAEKSRSIHELLRQLRTDITRRRKENHDERMKRNWNPDDILRREQSNLLDWIEAELDQIG